MPNDLEPSGFFRVINDTLGTIAKGAESYYDVRAARGETTVTPAPATKTPPGTTPGTTSPEAAIAAGKAGPVAGLSTQTLLIIGVAALAALALIAVVVRRK